jgi:cell division transport system ATP-binding protein
LADEPTGNLDPDTSDEIMALLHSICEDYGTAILMATHDYSILQKFRSRIIRTEHGRITDHASVVY